MRITAVELDTAQPAAQQAFWGETLGLPVEPLDRGAFAVTAGGTRLTFRVAAEALPLAHLAFNVPENLISDARDWIAERTPILPNAGEEITDFSFWNAHSVYFADPEGNVLEAIARHGLDNPSDAAFGPDALLEVSEVGLQVADVGEAVAWLEDELGLPFHSGDRRTFSSVGDERGVFILVPDGRPWLPTDTPAGQRPLVVTIAGGPPGEHVLPGTPYRIVSA